LGKPESRQPPAPTIMSTNGDQSVRSRITPRLLEATDRESLSRIRRELIDDGEKEGNVDVVISELRKKGHFKFDGRKEIMRADSAEALKEIRRELIEKGFKEGSIDAVVSILRKRGNLAFGQLKAIPLSRESERIKYNRSAAQLWEEYREKKAELLREYKEKVAQLLQQYEEKAAQKRKSTKDEVKRLQAEVEARDSLLKKLMKRLNQPNLREETGEQR